jgi:hypothetical protein
MRDEAAKELQAAIDSTKLKLQAKQVDLATLHSPEDNELTRQQIADVQEVIADMEQRVRYTLPANQLLRAWWMVANNDLYSSSSSCKSPRSTLTRPSTVQPRTPLAVSSAPLPARPIPRPASRRLKKGPRISRG